VNQFSPIIFGAWRLADTASEANSASVARKVTAALEFGINTFDHADIYGDYSCEELFGAAITKSKIPRDKYKIITKCGIKLVSQQRPEHGLKTYDTGARHINASVERSLKNLNTDHIDLLLIHRPDPLLNPDEVADTFNRLKQQGKVLNFGVSNFSTQQVRMLQSRLDAPLIANQIEFSLLNTDPLYNGQLDQCLEMRMTPMAWSPLAGGRIFSAHDDRTQPIRVCLNQLSEKYNIKSPETLAYAWLLKHPANVKPVVGTGKPERLKSAMDALSLKLDHEDWFQLLKAAVGTDVP
jgi:predicted oxidoreductase